MRERRIQGNQARLRREEEREVEEQREVEEGRGVGWRSGEGRWGGVWVGRFSGVWRWAGCQNLRRRMRARMEEMEETISTSQGPWKLEMRNWGMLKARPAVRQAGQTPRRPRSPEEAATTEKGTRREKKGSWRPTMAERARGSMPETPERARMGVPRAPKATGAVLAMREREAAWRGLKPSWMRMAEVTATGVPKPAAPSKKAPKLKAMRTSWMRGSGAR